MALGFSGSNGGLTGRFSQYPIDDRDSFHTTDSAPMEVSFFANNSCNLHCRHCYVGYDRRDGSLSFHEWQAVFESLIFLGAKTFGNVGKEPLRSWDLTNKLLRFFGSRRLNDSSIRFGLVTNGLLLNPEVLAELEAVQPDYIDVSVDGTQEQHDWIRGEGTHAKLMSKLEILSASQLRESVFISVTLNSRNINSIGELVVALHERGFRNLLFAPYVSLDSHDELCVDEDQLTSVIRGIVRGEVIDFSLLDNTNVYFKNDFATTYSLMERMSKERIIRKDRLLADDYGAIFDMYHLGSNKVYLNYMPIDTSFHSAIRISHDGYVSNCLDMFHSDYPARAAGNIRSMSIEEILSGADYRSQFGVANVDQRAIGTHA